MASPSQVPFRLAVWGFAAVLAVQAMWLLAVELVRPRMPYFPSDQAAAELAQSKRAQAGWAAALGVVRGDLWADYASSLAGGMIGDLLGFGAAQAAQTSASQTSAAQASASADAERAALRAARLAPHDARAWLLLAAAASRPDRLNRDVGEPLKMSYYTGPDEPELMALRIRVATRSDAIDDGDLQVLVAQDLRAIALRRHELKPAVVAAYRYAVPAGKQFIEATLAKVDPAFLAALRGAGQKR
jgi:hypothetical protein